MGWGQYNITFGHNSFVVSYDDNILTFFKSMFSFSNLELFILLIIISVLSFRLIPPSLGENLQEKNKRRNHDLQVRDIS